MLLIVQLQQIDNFTLRPLETHDALKLVIDLLSTSRPHYVSSVAGNDRPSRQPRSVHAVSTDGHHDRPLFLCAGRLSAI